MPYLLAIGYNLLLGKQNHFSMKIRANDIDLTNAERFDSFSSVIFNCKNKYCCFNKKLNNTRYHLALIFMLKMLLALIFMLKMFSFRIFSLPKITLTIIFKKKEKRCEIT